MNNLVSAGYATGGSETRARKYLEIVILSSERRAKIDGVTEGCAEGDTIVTPPLAESAFDIREGDLVALIELPFLPLKSAVRIPAERATELKKACVLAAEMSLQGGGVKDALGALIAALIGEYAAGNAFSPAVQSVIDDIEKNVGIPSYSLEDFMRRLPLNYDYMRKLFKKETGFTPLEYLTRTRMELAASILRSGVTNRYSRYTVSQVAEACGYAEPLYFSRVFRKYFGTPPSEYNKIKSKEE